MTRKTLAKGRAAAPAGRGFLDGQMLIASPTMSDERFARSVVYICAHSSEGAMGIVVNRPAANISFPDLLVKLNVIPAAELIRLPTRAGGVTVLKGGPVETERGFVLHSADFFIENSTLPIDEGICLTATLDILKAIARGDGPASAILAPPLRGFDDGAGHGDTCQRSGTQRHLGRRRARRGRRHDRGLFAQVRH
jgi:putative transcriptional regulator